MIELTVRKLGTDRYPAYRVIVTVDAETVMDDLFNAAQIRNLHDEIVEQAEKLLVERESADRLEGEG